MKDVAERLREAKIPISNDKLQQVLTTYKSLLFERGFTKPQVDIAVESAANDLN